MGDINIQTTTVIFVHSSIHIFSGQHQPTTHPNHEWKVENFAVMYSGQK